MITHNVKEPGKRFDIYMMSILTDKTRTKIQELIKSKKILINGQPSKSSFILRGTEIINYKIENNILDSEVRNKIKKETIHVDILFEDDSIIVINKPSGLVVHPGAGNRNGTLLNGLIDKIDTDNFESNPGIVHRLDKETSGIMVVAKNHTSHSYISKQFQDRQVKKKYHALTWGTIDKQGAIEGNMIRNNRDRKSFILTDRDGRWSKTTFKLEKNIGPISIVELKPFTGRTHQIRVHMKSIGHPIISDNLYSGGKTMIKSFHTKYTNLLKNITKAIPRVALHASSIEFIHPTTQNKENFSAPLSVDMKEAISILENYELQ